MKKEGMPRRGNAYHHGDLRRALMECGFELLEQADGADLSLRKLARMAEVSPGAVYRHFANKEELLVALATEGFAQLMAEQVDAYREVVGQAQSVLKAFRASGLAYVRFALRNPALFRLMFGRFSATHGSQQLADASRAHGEALMKAISWILGSGANKEQVEMFQVGSWSLIHGLSSLVIDHQLRGDTAGVEALAEKIILNASQWEEYLDET